MLLLDIYITKPFEIMELLARVEALLLHFIKDDVLQLPFWIKKTNQINNSQTVLK